MINTMFKRSMSYEKSLIEYSKTFDRYTTDLLTQKLNGETINLKNIYNYYKDLIQQPNNYDKDDKLVILIIFIYKFYSNKLVDKQYYSLWKNKDIDQAEEICEYKYILYEINDLWRNLSGINRMDDYEKIISENLINVDIKPYIISIQNNSTIEQLNDDIIKIKKDFEDKIFNIPNPKCDNIKVNYSYYILVILYYIHYTINKNEEKKGNNTLDDELPYINYDEYISNNTEKYCSTEKSFIDAYNTSKSFKPNIKSLTKGIPKGLSLPKGLPKGLSLPKQLPKGLPKGLSLPKQLPSSEGLTNPLAASMGKVSAGLLPQK